MFYLNLYNIEIPNNKIPKNDQYRILTLLIDLSFIQFLFQNKSIHKPSLFHILFKQVFYFYCILSYLILFTIVFNTIVKYQFHVINVLLNIVIYIVVEFLFYCTKIHRLLDYLKIVINTVFSRIHWLQEKVTAFCFLT